LCLQQLSYRDITAKKDETKSKRQIVREQRVKRQRQQRLLTIGIVAAVALAVAFFLIAPSIRNAMTPVGEIIQITPEARASIDGRAIGDVSAPVLVEVWSDFQCPACQSFAQSIEPQVVQNYAATGKIRYEYRHFPFLDDRSSTKESDQAANASMCANEQGKFWEYHDYLFANWDGENQGAFNDKRLVAFAEALGLDTAAFNDCFQENRYKDDIAKDLADGDQAGVQGTPSVFVNETNLKPGFIPSYEEIAQAIDAALAGQ
jgi:protein-disulfide isomerase